MLKWLIKKIPEQYRILVFLVTTSFAGVGLILVAVYNASNELEIIHEIDNTHRFISSQLLAKEVNKSSIDKIFPLEGSGYQPILVREEDELVNINVNDDMNKQLHISELYSTRVNEKGGYIELEDRVFTWVQFELTENGMKYLVIHQFSSEGVKSLMSVYVKRLLVPALFYVWLMVWMGYIVRFLTKKLSDQKKAMEHMALHDTLTGLPNRNLLDDRLNKMIEVARRDKGHFTVVLMDLDGFKKVNDTYGHAVGDMLLKEVAQRLSSCVRPYDTVCRLGGDEFILLLDDMKNDSTLDICRRISIEISKPFAINEIHVEIGSSMGVVRYRDYTDSVGSIIHKADQAMYEVKAAGGGIQLFDATSEGEPDKDVEIYKLKNKSRVKSG